MSDRELTTLTRTQGANQALKDGTVTPAGYSLRFEEIPVLVKGFRRMVRDLEFDVSEMALTTYLTAREHGVAFTALPIFLVRGFHHAADAEHKEAPASRHRATLARYRAKCHTIMPIRLRPANAARSC